MPPSLLLSYTLALAGLACFLWPVVKKLRGQEEVDMGLRSPWRWAGFGLTLAALVVQKMAFSV